jgi:hypothetical protein
LRHNRKANHPSPNEERIAGSGKEAKGQNMLTQNALTQDKHILSAHRQDQRHQSDETSEKSLCHSAVGAASSG